MQKWKREALEFVKLWIVLEIIIALFIINSLGMSGLARKFCDVFPMEKCEEIDWEYYGEELLQ